MTVTDADHQFSPAPVRLRGSGLPQGVDWVDPEGASGGPDAGEQTRGGHHCGRRSKSHGELRKVLVLASIAAAVGLMAADRTLTWGIERAYADKGGGGAPFWMTPGLELATILYASGLAVVGAAMVSLLPALRATRSRVQSNLANLGTGGATLRFGRVWTSAMIAQVALTAMGSGIAAGGGASAVGRRARRTIRPACGRC